MRVRNEHIFKCFAHEKGQKNKGEKGTIRFLAQLNDPHPFKLWVWDMRVRNEHIFKCFAHEKRVEEKSEG